MLFSSISFLYYFLPILLLFYFFSSHKYKNMILLIFSLFFYFYGDSKYIILLIFSCIINFILGLLIDKYRNKSKLILLITLTINISFFLVFKYTDFIIYNFNELFNTNFSLLRITLPLGISFFTFQTMSYVIDIYNRKLKPTKNFLIFATYICLFPQLVAGPIVRYVDIEKELKNRNHTIDSFAYGIKRFVLGLAKKVLIANTVGELSAILLSLTEATVVSYWLNAITFTIQIYYDFSGYSDMAIGLGRMFGFKFPENFNYPYVATSITDFWRRWHMTLSSWFRDYVYIPLGGNRVKKTIWYRNILIVWFLTGMWHGAQWNFILWGLYFSIILLLEKKILTNFLSKHKIFSHFYTLFLVIISFLIFNTDLSNIILQLKFMFGIDGIPFINNETIYYMKSYLIILIISIVGCTPLFKNFCNKHEKIFKFIEPIYYIVLLIIVTAYLIDSSFNPFLYFRF